ncbi:MAG: phenylacetate--CoA ligase family protein [Bryobacterales bacterium]|nr:phenylacetate--CoA ligase family protein [Bryobacterales bacterium]
MSAQLAALRVLLAAILPGNRFYARKLEGVSGITSLEDFRRRVPFTTKQELVDDQAAHPPFGKNHTFPLSWYTRYCQTSGTSGQPMRWLDTPESWEWMLENWDRVYSAAGVTAADNVFFAFSFGPFLGFWTAFEAAARMGCLAIPGGGMRTAARLRTLLDAGATVLCGTPTYVIHLGEAAPAEGIDLSRSGIRRIIVAGEPGGSVPGTRAHIEKLWPGAKVADHHGMTEIGPVSYECPARPCVLHVMEDRYIAEVIDPATDEPAGSGELVLTNLGRTAAPLIRYRTGDLVRPALRGRCACGTDDLALEGGILGRADDMVVVRGVNVYPTAIEDVLRGCGVAEYRVEVRVERALTELSLEVEPGPEDGPDLEHRIQAALYNALALRIPVVVVPGGTLPRFEMKARRWLRR